MAKRIDTLPPVTIDGKKCHPLGSIIFGPTEDRWEFSANGLPANTLESLYVAADIVRRRIPVKISLSLVPPKPKP